MLRAVVREDLSYEMATDLVTDLKTVVEWLDHHFTYSGRPCNLMAGHLHEKRSPWCCCRQDLAA